MQESAPVATADDQHRSEAALVRIIRTAASTMEAIGLPVSFSIDSQDIDLEIVEGGNHVGHVRTSRSVCKEDVPVVIWPLLNRTGKVASISTQLPSIIAWVHMCQPKAPCFFLPKPGTNTSPWTTLDGMPSARHRRKQDAVLAAVADAGTSHFRRVGEGRRQILLLDVVEHECTHRLGPLKRRRTAGRTAALPLEASG